MSDYDAQIICLNRANNSPQVAAIDAEVSKLASQWKPTGFYYPSDIQTMINTLETQAEEAGKALAAAPRSTGDAEAMIAQAFDDLINRYQVQARLYAQTLASVGGGVIDAPNFKRWVLASMRAISDAYVTATVLQCRQSWVEWLLDKAYRAMAAIGAVAWKIGGVVYQAGVAVVKAVEVTAGLLGTLLKIAPYAAFGLVVLFGGVYLRGKYRSVEAASERDIDWASVKMRARKLLPPYGGR